MSFEPRAAAGAGIPLCAPEIRGSEWKYVRDCLETGWVSSVGKYVDRFEREIAGYVGAACGVATVNGTAALHVSLLVAGVRPDDEVLVSTLSFIAPANAVRYAGAWPVFIDAEPDYWQMDPGKAVDFLERGCRWEDGKLVNRVTGRTVRAILPVHILGHPADMDPLIEIAKKYRLAVIEDATESLGAKYRDRRTGRLGDIACFSFNGNKLLTTGGGGMIVTDNEQWARRARHLTTQAKDDPVEYIHGEIGFNHRLSNVQAAIGCAQLEQVESYISAKRSIAARYGEAFRDMPGVRVMREAAWAQGVFWMFTVLVDAKVSGREARSILRDLAGDGIQTRPLWQPLHLSPAHEGAQAWHCDVAVRLYREALSLPCSVGLDAGDQETVIRAFRRSLGFSQKTP